MNWYTKKSKNWIETAHLLKHNKTDISDRQSEENDKKVKI